MIEKLNMGKIDQQSAAQINSQAQQVIGLKKQLSNSDIKEIDGLPWLKENPSVQAWKAKQQQ